MITWEGRIANWLGRNVYVSPCYRIPKRRVKPPTVATKRREKPPPVATKRRVKPTPLARVVGQSELKAEASASTDIVSFLFSIK